MATEAYCVKCKKKRNMKNPQPTTFKNKNRVVNASKGTCPDCGTGMFKILPKK